jgi:hypothetical protein
MEWTKLEAERSRISVDPGEILNLLGISEPEMDPHTRELVDSYLIKCSEIISPQGGIAWCHASGLDKKGELEIEGIRFHVGKIIARQLHAAEAVALFAVTAGAGPEALSRELMAEGHYLEAYIVDLIGSGIVESVADQVHEQVRLKARAKGMKITNRYSPGYCSWDVKEQQKLFSILPGGCCGITLSESSLMSPIKSVSGIIAAGPEVTFNPSTCSICPMKNCTYRKIIV